MRNYLVPLMLLALALPGSLLADSTVLPSDSTQQESPEAQISDVPAFTPQELEEYEFDAPGEANNGLAVQELSFGQKFVMGRQRQEVLDLLGRHLGILELKQNTEDLKALARLVALQVIANSETLVWQAIGVVMGDVMAHEFDMHWVTVEDELGASKALQWKETRNFVFPVTLLSRRIQFNQPIDILAVFDKVKSDVEDFKDYEETYRKLRLPGLERLDRESSRLLTE